MQFDKKKCGETAEKSMRKQKKKERRVPFDGKTK
jgi:hypothetical protein